MKLIALYTHDHIASVQRRSVFKICCGIFTFDCSSSVQCSELLVPCNWVHDFVFVYLDTDSVLNYARSKLCVGFICFVLAKKILVYVLNIEAEFFLCNLNLVNEIK